MRNPFQPVVRALALSLSPVLALLAPASLPAHAETAAAVVAPVPVAARPALWKIADADTTIWLFGTIHALPPGIHWMDGPVVAALRDSAQLVTEIPETDPAAMQSAVMGHALLPEGQTLRALLTEADRPKFEAALAGVGLPPEAFDRFEPWYAAVALTTLPLAKSGYTAANGVEEQISAEHRRLGRLRIGLETAEDQLAMFDSLPRDVQLRYLHEVLEGLPTLDSELAGIVREWSAGHAEKLAELLNADEDDPRMVTVLLTNRNHAWADWLGKRLNQPGTVFMAVGAGHLAGKDSVQALLKQRGIVAVRVQ